MTIKADIEVLDSNICSQCKLLHVVNYPTELWGGDAVVAIDNHYQCDHIHQCRYLLKLFASKATPKVEEAKVP